MKELKIVAQIIVKKDYQNELEIVFRSLVNKTRKEEGNISYDLFQSLQNPLEYTILETWNSQEAIDFHNSTPHFNSFKDAITNKIDNLSISVMEKIY